MKTKRAWHESKLPLGEYLQPGDVVDEEMMYYFLEVLFPACYSSRCIQIGEPYTHTSNGEPMFSTLERIDGNWVYTGIKTTPATEQALYVQ